ncbi:MAG: hypothetical protein ACT4OM_06040 [Actinomycetota bacterium]
MHPTIARALDAAPRLSGKAPDQVLARELATLLSVPQQMAEVEEIENGIKELWRAGLGRERMSRPQARAFVRFFREIGFTYKYKPYGVKIASPFGYSVFDLNPNQGFSFQVHAKPKREAFVILEVKQGGFVFMCSQQEWGEGALRWVREWADEQAQEGSSPYVWMPSPGETIPVSAPGVVHTVIGCVLEEFASCSVDAVVRLFDQNSRTGFTLPQAHPGVGELLMRGYPGVPDRSVERAAGMWESRPLAAGAPVIDVPGNFTGARKALPPGGRIELAARPGWVTTIVPVSGDAFLATAGLKLQLRVGELVSIPPGWAAELESREGATLAVHSVAAEIVLMDWS